MTGAEILTTVQDDCPMPLLHGIIPISLCIRSRRSVEAELMLIGKSAQNSAAMTHRWQRTVAWSTHPPPVFPNRRCHTLLPTNLPSHTRTVTHRFSGLMAHPTAKRPAFPPSPPSPPTPLRPKTSRYFPILRRSAASIFSSFFAPHCPLLDAVVSFHHTASLHPTITSLLLSVVTHNTHTPSVFNRPRSRSRHHVPASPTDPFSSRARHSYRAFFIALVAQSTISSKTLLLSDLRRVCIPTVNISCIQQRTARLPTSRLRRPHPTHHQLFSCTSGVSPTWHAARRVRTFFNGTNQAFSSPSYILSHICTPPNSPFHGPRR